MHGSWASVHTTSTIIQLINTNNINCNHMRQRKSVQSPNIYIPFGVNKSNWLKKVSTPASTSNCNDQRHRTANSVAWNRALTTTKATKRRRRHASSSRSTSIIINWNNIRCRRLNSRSRHLLPTLTTTTAAAATTTTTHFGRENILTNLNVHFECDNCYFFNTSPKIYSR